MTIHVNADEAVITRRLARHLIQPVVQSQKVLFGIFINGQHIRHSNGKASWRGRGAARAALVYHVNRVIAPARLTRPGSWQDPDVDSVIAWLAEHGYKVEIKPLTEAT